MKFEDLDADGVKDAGEPGLEGWTITRPRTARRRGESLDVTDASGAYS